MGISDLEPFGQKHLWLSGLEVGIWMERQFGGTEPLPVESSAISGQIVLELGWIIGHSAGVQVISCMLVWEEPSPTHCELSAEPQVGDNPTFSK